MNERDWAHLARALKTFGQQEEGEPLPGNAITLWRAIVRGIERVADALTLPPEK